MFRGEKTLLFWAGLIVLSLASLFLFAIIWSYRTYWSYSNWWNVTILDNLPVIIGTIYFIFVGLFMMKSGVKKDKPV